VLPESVFLRFAGVVPQRSPNRTNTGNYIENNKAPKPLEQCNCDLSDVGA
jgi:hypothetical protein